MSKPRRRSPPPRAAPPHRRSGRPTAYQLGGEQIEGRHAVLELLRAGNRPVRELWVAEGLEPSSELDDIERLANRRRVRTLVVSRGRLDAAARTDSHQGVLALARPLAEADLEALLSTGAGPPFLVVLDGITDPQNLGSLVRSAECAGVTGMVLGRHRAVHVTPAVAKVAAGAVEHVPIAVVPGIPMALARLRQAGVAVVGLDAEAPRRLYDLGPEVEGPLALVLGAEGRGLGRLTRARCTTLAAIPLVGRLESLNVASAGAVAIFEMARRRAME